MALIPYLDASDMADADRDLLAPPFNLQRALANSPKALRQIQTLGQWIRSGSTLDPRLRELAILQVGYLSGNEYEWSHHIKIGMSCGVTADDILAISSASEGRPHLLGRTETAVLRGAREITTNQHIGREAWADLELALDHEQIVDLVTIVSLYSAVVRIISTLRIDVEPEFVQYVTRFPVHGTTPPG